MRGGTQGTPYRYASQRLEAGLGLYDYKARYYDPGIGRFIQPDTVVPRPGNPQSLNRYSYVDDNPLRYTDPSGHCIPGVNCLGMMSGVSAPSDPSPHLRGAAYARWLVHYILLLEQQQGETGGMLDLATSQNNAGFELGTLWLGSGDFPEELDRQLMASAPQIAANAAGASHEFLVTSAEWVVGLVLKQGEQSFDRGAQDLVGTKVYRVWGEEPSNPDMPGSKPWGHSWTTVDPRLVPDYREAAGLPSGGESEAYNAGRFVSEGVIKDASGVRIRRSLAVDGKSGGLIELLVPDPQAQIELTGVYGVNPPY